jgi:hypothetical protein
MDPNRRRFQKQITQVLCWNAVKEIQMLILPQIYNYSGLPHFIISELVRKWLRHLPYDMENVKG